MAFQKKIYSNNWNRDLYVNVAFEKNQVTEGEDTVIVESVINNKWLPLPFLLLILSSKIVLKLQTWNVFQQMISLPVMT